MSTSEEQMEFAMPALATATFEEQMKFAMSASLATETERKKAESDILAAIKSSKTTAKVEVDAEAKETRGRVEILQLGPTGFGEVIVYCPGCDLDQKLYYKVRGNRRQLVNGAGGPTCHTIMCNCPERTTSMSKDHANKLEEILLAGERDSYFGEGSTQVSDAAEMRLYLQKDQPESEFRKGDQFPQHLSPLACKILGVTLTNYRIVLGDIGEVPFTVVNTTTQ